MNSEEEELTSDELTSDYDGFTRTRNKCKFCKLATHDELYTESGFCKSCKNYATIVQINRFTKNLSFQVIIFSVFIYFLVPPFRSYILPIVIAIYVPVLLFGSLQYRIHYKGIPKHHRIVHQLKMYKLLNDITYYNMALEIWETSIELINPDLQNVIINELVDSILLDGKPNPPKLFKKWGIQLSMSESEFLSLLINDTSILDGISVFGGTGLLPDIWPFVEDLEIKKTIMETLVKSCDNLEHASFEEKKIFLEDLYLIEDELVEFIDEEPSWQIILEKLDEFVPDIPPKNIFQQAQMQSNNQNKMLLAKQENRELAQENQGLAQENQELTQEDKEFVKENQ